MTLRSRCTLLLAIALAAAPDAAAQDRPVREDTLCLPLGRGLAAAVIRRNAAGDSVVVTAEGEVPWRKVAREHAAGRPWFERREQIFLPS